MTIKKVGVVGLGLIGGSIARKLAADSEVEVFAWNHNERPYEEANSVGISCTPTLGELIDADCDLYILAVPMSKLSEYFEKFAAVDAIVSDVASVKVYPADLAAQFKLKRYVGLHPMFGTEFTGFSASSATLGDDALWAFCAPTSARDGDITSVVGLIETHLAGRALQLDAKTHDQTVALTSHLPHVLAYEFAALISDQAEQGKVNPDLNAGSFHGATRVARGNEQLFRDMLTYNKDALIDLLDETVEDLIRLRVALQSDHQSFIDAFIERSAAFRD